MSDRQFNVRLSERYAVALLLLTAREDTSVPEILRPIIERYLDDEMADDTDYGRSVEAMMDSRLRRNAAKRVTNLSRPRRRPSR